MVNDSEKCVNDLVQSLKGEVESKGSARTDVMEALVLLRKLKLTGDETADLVIMKSLVILEKALKTLT